MAEYSDDVIDLCDSFIRLDPPSYMRDVCIVLDSDDSVLLDTEESFAGHVQSNSLTSSVATSACKSVTNSGKPFEDFKKNVAKRHDEKKVNSKRNSIKRHKFGDCPICFDPLGQNPLASTKCGHVYCSKCIEQYLLVDQRCPTCRQKLKGKSSYHPLYLSN